MRVRTNEVGAVDAERVGVRAGVDAAGAAISELQGLVCPPLGFQHGVVEDVRALNFHSRLDEPHAHVIVLHAPGQANAILSFASKPEKEGIGVRYRAIPNKRQQIRPRQKIQ